MSSQIFVRAQSAGYRGRNRDHSRISSLADLKPVAQPSGNETSLAPVNTTGLDLQLHQQDPLRDRESSPNPPHFLHTQFEVTQTELTQARAEQRYLELTRLELVPIHHNPAQFAISPVLPTAEPAATSQEDTVMATGSPVYILYIGTPPQAAPPGPPPQLYMLTPTGLVPVTGSPAPAPPGFTVAFGAPHPPAPPPPAPAMILQLSPPPPPPPQSTLVLQLAAPPAPPPPPPPQVLLIAYSAPAPAPPPEQFRIHFAQ